MDDLRFEYLQSRHLPLIHAWWEDSETRWLEEPTSEYVEYVTEEDGEHHFVVYDGADPVAVAGFGLEEDGAHVAIAVRPGHRRKGYGRRIIVELTRRARAEGTREIAAWVFPRNNASAALFTGLGFREIGRTDDGSIEYRLSQD